MKQKSKPRKTKGFKAKAKKVARGKKTTSKVVRKVAKKPVKTATKKVTKKIVKKTLPKVIKEGIISAKKPTDIQLLEQLFGGPSKMKLWKIFTLNSSKKFTLKDLTKLTKSKSETLILDLREFMRKGVIQATAESILSKSNKKEKQIIYSLVHDFPLLPEITQIILTAIPRSPEKVLELLQSLSKLKTILLSGFFTSKLGVSAPIQSVSQSTIDLLLIFEKIPANIQAVIGELEYQLGRELRYASMDQEDFKYRHSIGDRLVRDVLDFEHIVAMDKMGFFK